MSPRLPLADVMRMSEAQRFRYFRAYAGFLPDAPGAKYVIGVGSTTLCCDDTMGLLAKFEAFVHVQKTRRSRRSRK